MTAEIISLAKQFHLNVLSRGKFAPRQGLSNEEYLLELIRAEAESRDKRAEAERIKQVRLPTYKGFEEFDTDFQKGITREQLDTLAKLEWLDAMFNLVLIGPPGTGKTHIALAVGNKVVRLQGIFRDYGRHDAHPQNTGNITKKRGSSAVD